MLRKPYFFSIGDSATLLGLAEAEVRQLISSGRLHAGKLEGEYRITRLDLLAYASRKFDTASLDRINAETE